MTSSITGLLSIALYLLASGLLVARLARGPVEGRGGGTRILLIATAALVIHATLLYPAILTGSGLNLGFVNAASLIALLTTALLLIAAFREPVENLGIVVFAVAAASIALLLLYPARPTGSSTSWQLDTHILISLLAYSILGLAVLQALLLAIQERHLHNRQPGGFIRALPPLQTMETLMFEMIGVGFAIVGDLWSSADRSHELAQVIGASAIAGSGARSFSARVGTDTTRRLSPLGCSRSSASSRC